MKRVLITITVVICLCLMMTGADFISSPDTTQIKIKKNCVGYTIIEAGKGIDCNGDTIKLIKTNGFYKLISKVD